MKQLELLTVRREVQLTERQAHALGVLLAAGTDGLHADRLGAAMHEWSARHAAGDRCLYCGSTGNELLRALRRKGVARYRRGTADTPGYWQATNAAPTPARGMLSPDEDLPF